MRPGVPLHLMHMYCGPKYTGKSMVKCKDHFIQSNINSALRLVFTERPSINNNEDIPLLGKHLLHQLLSYPQLARGNPHYELHGLFQGLCATAMVQSNCNNFLWYK